MSKNELLRHAGIGETTLRRWELGGASPQRANLDRVVGVLNAPQLYETITPVQISTDAYMTSMTCGRCGDTRSYRSTHLRGTLKKGSLPGAVVDYELGRGTYPECGRCRMSTSINTTLAKMKKRYGRDGTRRILAERAPGISEEARRKGLAHANSANFGAKRTEEQRRTIGRAGLQPRKTGGRFGICNLCRQLTFVQTVPAAPPARGEVHATCWHAWLYRNHSSAANAYPKRGKGARWNSDDLMDSYEMVIRHKVRQETIESVADRFGLDSKTIEYRIKRFLALLPTDGRGGAWLQRRGRLLLD